MFNIVVFDDHPVITSAIVASFASNLPDYYTISFNTTSNTLQYLKQHEVHYLISDLITSETAGIDLINEVVSKYPGIRIIVYSGVTNEFIIGKLKRMGILEFVSKQEYIEKLADIIKEDSSKQDNIKRTPLQFEHLTKREKQIVDLLVLGKGSKEIASELEVSVNTVNNQKNTLLKKYDCANSVELVTQLSKLGYINFI